MTAQSNSTASVQYIRRYTHGYGAVFLIVIFNLAVSRKYRQESLPLSVSGRHVYSYTTSGRDFPLSVYGRSRRTYVTSRTVCLSSLNHKEKLSSTYVSTIAAGCRSRMPLLSAIRAVFTYQRMIIGHNTIHPAVSTLTSAAHRISLSRFLFVLFLIVFFPSSLWKHRDRWFRCKKDLQCHTQKKSRCRDGLVLCLHTDITNHAVRIYCGYPHH